MALPDFQTIMLPALRALAKRDISTAKEVIEQVVDHFKVAPDEREQLLPSGKQRVIDNRTLWALSYLGKAGLIAKPGRGRYGLSDLGRKVLKDSPSRIDIPFLNQFDAFRQFRAVRPKEDKAVPGGESEQASADDKNPLEAMERNFADLRAAVADELLRTVRGLDPTDFEKLVIDLLKKMGYGVPGRESVVHRGGSGDGGIDGEISQDPLGLDMIYMQAKRYAEDSPVGRPALQQFAGSLHERKANKGVFITTSHFTSEAKEFLNRVDVRIVSIDGERLAGLMYDHGVGVESELTFEVKKVALDYFEFE